MRNNGIVGYGMRLFVVTLLIYSAACTDGPVETGQKAAGATRPSLVERVDLPDGQSLLRLGLDDARVVITSNYGFRSLDPTSYAEQGIVVDSARIEREEWTGGLPHARTGGTWLLSGFYLRSYDYHYPPIVISFNAKAPGVAKVVRVHVGTYYWFNSELNPERGEAGLTCYSGASVVATQRLVLAPPDYWYRGRPEYMPLEVRGDSITSCSAKLGPYVAMDDIEVVFQKEEKASLTLECVGDLGANQVTRGRELHCLASASDTSATLNDIRWIFEDSAGHRVNGPPDSSVWRGPMVIRGTVHVSAVLNGDTVKENKGISVRARTWPRLHLSTPAHDSLHGHLPVIPTILPNGHLANPGELADSHLERDPGNMPWGNNYVGINSGPNTGYWYVTQPLRRPTFLVHTSDAFSPGNPWYERQHGPHPYCTKHDVRIILRRRARAHEGIGPPIPGDPYQPTYSHYSAARRWFATQVDVNKLFEEKVSYHQPSASGGTFMTFPNQLEVMWIEKVQDPHETYNYGLVHTPTNLMLVHCLFRP